MRLCTLAIVVAFVVAVFPAPSWAQAKAKVQHVQFGGLKLVDPQNPRGLETDVSLRVDSDRLILIDPVQKKEVKSFPYSSITGIDDTLSITPPLPPEVLSRNSTGSSSMPSYLGKEAHHWWTINSGGAPTIIRVSSKVYKDMKAAVGEHNVKIQDVDTSKKKKS
jgi:hypothetical protein